MPAFYPKLDEEDDDLAARERDVSEEEYVPNLPSQAQAIALDQQFSQQLPQPNFDVPASLMRGEANKEFYSGRPGLFVQGGPSVPAGMIQVNGQLERSQAAPKPVPWWITQADEFKEQRRQEDFLRGLVSQTGKSGPAAIERMQQLQGRLQLQADLKSGLPLRDALVKNAANLYAGSRGALTSLARIAAPPRPIPTGVTEFTGQSGRKYFVNPATGGVTPLTESPQRASHGEVTPVDEYRAISADLRSLKKDLSDAVKYDDKEEAARLRTVIKDTETKRDQVKTKKSTESASIQAAPAATQTQTGPRSALANQLVKEHPEWSDAQIFAEVKKRLNLK